MASRPICGPWNESARSSWVHEPCQYRGREQAGSPRLRCPCSLREVPAGRAADIRRARSPRCRPRPTGRQPSSPRGGRFRAVLAFRCRIGPTPSCCLYLVYDEGSATSIWRPLRRELHRVIGQTGAFRGVRLLVRAQDGWLRQFPGGWSAVLPPHDGRAVALVLSDCSGSHGYAGSEAATHRYRVLGRWARTMPVAVVEPLPERLWRRTPLPGSAGLLTARGPAAANSALRFTPYDPPGAELAGLPLPLLEPSARWFTHWAEFCGGMPWHRGAGGATLAADPSTGPLEPGGSAPPSLSPEELVINFRAYASPQVLRLAAHVAAGEPSLPMMCLVQAATEARPEPQHLAEVVLSGLLTTVPDRLATSGHYAFRPGVREVLLRALPRSTATRIGAVIQHHAGFRPGEFPVVASTGDIEGEGSRPSGEPLAVVTEETVRRLGGGTNTGAEGADMVADSACSLVDGRYRLGERRYAGPTFDTWRATDEQLDRDVILKFFHAPITDDARRHRFLADADRLAGLEIQGLARVGGFGFHDGRPYAVTDPVDGEGFEQRFMLAPGSLLAWLSSLRDGDRCRTHPGRPRPAQRVGARNPALPSGTPFRLPTRVQ
ncbi:SAV_2336 family protein [Streptomyces tubercidicus]